MTGDVQTGTGAANATQTYNNNSEVATSTATGTNNGTDLGTDGYTTSGVDPGQVNTIKDTGGTTDETFGYNNDGDRTSCTSITALKLCSNHSTSASYGYDGADRLTSESDTGGYAELFSYDGNGELQEYQETVPGACPPIKPVRCPQTERPSGNLRRKPPRRVAGAPGPQGLGARPRARTRII